MSDCATGPNLAWEEGVRGTGELDAGIIEWCRSDAWEIRVCDSRDLSNRNSVTKERVYL